MLQFKCHSLECLLIVEGILGQLEIKKKTKKVGKQETAKIVKQGWSPIPADIQYK